MLVLHESAIANAPLRRCFSMCHGWCNAYAEEFTLNHERHLHVYEPRAFVRALLNQQLNLLSFSSISFREPDHAP